MTHLSIAIRIISATSTARFLEIVGLLASHIY